MQISGREILHPLDLTTNIYLVGDPLPKKWPNWGYVSRYTTWSGSFSYPHPNIGEIISLCHTAITPAEIAVHLSHKSVIMGESEIIGLSRFSNEWIQPIGPI